ncbi:MAG: ribonuclease P protein component 4 [archaeon]
MSRPKWVKRIAEERIKKLFEEAEAQFRKHPKRSDRYTELALKISERYNKTMSKNLKKKFCPSCHCYWVLGETVKVRADSRNNRVIYKCLKCGGKRTYGYSEEKQNKSN